MPIDGPEIPDIPAECPHCTGEMIQYEDGPDNTLECAWCDEDEELAPAEPPTPERR
jgi:hypothetical protein